MTKLQTALIAVQSELKAPKNQRNNFGKYNYRSAEDILEAVKPLLSANGLSMTISDSVQELSGMVVITSTATITDGTDSVSSSAQAGVDPNRKGMDIAQSFGSSSSYSRKYAMNGLLLIDDTKDADATNTHGNASSPAARPAAASRPAAAASGAEDKDWFSKSIDYIKSAANKGQAYEMVVAKYGATASEKQLAALSKFTG
tara:strand:- start:4370 stop:4972 length:603 start_codon:yes stop_codon:yes gene_type:complete